MDSIVVVGGGLAAGTAVTTLRDDGYDGRLTVVCAEPHPPYERPPLSKGFLLGDATLESTAVHPPEWYADHHVDLLTGTTATALDLAAHRVTAGDQDLGYDKLLLATGAMPRTLPLVAAVPAATTLRTREDSARIKQHLAEGRRLVVIGGGWIGLEVAAAGRTAGADVVVLETLDLPLLRVLGAEVAQAFADLHRRHGVDLRTGVTVHDVAIADGNDRATVSLVDGESFDADLLLVGVGVVPQTRLAEAAGLDVDDGILVDERLTTSDPDVLAAGDVANHWHPLLRRRLRVEHWDTAIGQGEAAARNLMGAGAPYDRLPYFYTDQYDLGMEYVGSVGPEGYDEVVVRGDLAGTFTAFWVADGRVVAGMHANDWDAIDPVRRIVAAGQVDLDRLRDAGVPLADVADGLG